MYDNYDKNHLIKILNFKEDELSYYASKLNDEKSKYEVVCVVAKAALLGYLLSATSLIILMVKIMGEC